MTFLREWRAELRRELADEYVAYIRDTGLAEYRATPGNLGALIAFAIWTTNAPKSLR